MTYQELCKINEQVKVKSKTAPKKGYNRIDKYRIVKVSSKDNKVAVERADNNGKYHDYVVYKTEQLLDLVIHGRACISNISLLADWKGFSSPKTARNTKPVLYVVNILLEDEGDGTYSNICKGVFSTERLAKSALDHTLNEYDEEQVYDYSIETKLLDDYR